MEITRTIKGTEEEMKSFFNEDNSVRFFNKKNDKFEVVLRVNENFKEPNIKSIQAYKEACKMQ